MFGNTGPSLMQRCTGLSGRLLAVLALAIVFAAPGWAACSGPVADGGARLRLVTMNNAHPTHYSDNVEPGVKFVLRGWDPAGGVPAHHLDYRDVKIHNVPTNVREFGGTRYSGNSIFVFDVADLCLAHLGHLHHTLTPGHLADLGPIDVVMVPVDGGYTLNQADMIEVLQQIKPKIAIPMHVFTQATLDKFLARAAEFYAVRRADDPAIVLTRAGLPTTPEILVLPGR